MSKVFDISLKSVGLGQVKIFEMLSNTFVDFNHIPFELSDKPILECSFGSNYSLC